MLAQNLQKINLCLSLLRIILVSCSSEPLRQGPNNIQLLQIDLFISNIMIKLKSAYL
jgi:hypothetical protein